MKMIRPLFLFCAVLALSLSFPKGLAAQPPTALPLVMLKAADAQLVTSALLKLEDNVDGGTIGWWSNTGDEVRWKLTVNAAGTYAVLVKMACQSQYAGSTVRVAVGTRDVTFTVPDTGNWYAYHVYSIGRLDLPAGTYPVVVKATNIGNQFVCNLEWIGFAGQSIGSAPSRLPPAWHAASAAKLKNRFIWIMYDAISSQADLTDAQSYGADAALRAWFKWGKAYPMAGQQWAVSGLQAQGTLFGGGGTLSALYPNEVTPAEFDDQVDRDPQNQPEHFFHVAANNYYHGDVQKKAYLDRILAWAYDQIDCGVDTLFLDEVQGAGSIYTGYSDLSMARFARYLADKYVIGRGWTKNDTRWQTVFGIDPALDTADGTIATFDYRKYLKRKGCASNPLAQTTPLLKEWGNPWDYLLHDTYLHRRDQDAWQYVVDSIRTYCTARNRHVLITANGWNDRVDYQIEGVWDRWQVTGGLLDVSPSYLGVWRGVIEQSNTLLGAEVPLLVFHDWGDGMPFFDKLSDADRILWLRVYAPEVFSSGAVFVWPVNNCGSKFKPSAALLQTMKQLMAWYDAHRDLYQQTAWAGTALGNLARLPQAVAAASDGKNRRIVHLINRQLDAKRNLVVRKNVVISVPSALKPKSVVALSPDFKGTVKLAFGWTNGEAEIKMQSLEAYTVVVISY